MSSLRQPNGDDYPEAAFKHLKDAEALLAAHRYDGAGYHAGYVVECALKTLLLHAGLVHRLRTHNLRDLSGYVAALVSDPRGYGQFIPQPPVAIPYATPPQGWKESMRYRAPGDLNRQQARQWVNEAKRVYRTSVREMIKKGLITP